MVIQPRERTSPPKDGKQLQKKGANFAAVVASELCADRPLDPIRLERYTPTGSETYPKDTLQNTDWVP